MYLGQEDTQGYGFTASPSPSFSGRAQPLCCLGYQTRGRGAEVADRLGGQGRLRIPIGKSPQVLREQWREMGVVRGPPPVFLNQQNSGRATFLNCNSGYAGSGE